MLIVATLVEDILTLGAGIPDDVPSFAAASVMFTSDIAAFKQVNGGTTDSD